MYQRYLCRTGGSLSKTGRAISLSYPWRICHFRSARGNRSSRRRGVRFNEHWKETCSTSIFAPVPHLQHVTFLSVRNLTECRDAFITWLAGNCVNLFFAFSCVIFVHPFVNVDMKNVCALWPLFLSLYLWSSSLFPWAPRYVSLQYLWLRNYCVDCDNLRKSTVVFICSSSGICSPDFASMSTRRIPKWLGIHMLHEGRKTCLDIYAAKAHFVAASIWGLDSDTRREGGLHASDDDDDKLDFCTLFSAINHFIQRLPHRNVDVCAKVTLESVMERGRGFGFYFADCEPRWQSYRVGALRGLNRWPFTLILEWMLNTKYEYRARVRTLS